MRSKIKKIIYLAMIGTVLVALIPPQRPNAELKAYYITELAKMEEKALDLSRHLDNEKERM